MHVFYSSVLLIFLLHVRFVLFTRVSMIITALCDVFHLFEADPLHPSSLAMNTETACCSETSFITAQCYTIQTSRI